jgi:DNA helicase II / ATP-dependent DNA helicase PcrA
MTTVIPTAEQSEVVAFPLRPLRVSAGAGTGKTTTMAMRLAALIEREQIDPEAALGITFTNKAAEELTDRLRRHLPDLAKLGREVEVTTYHGFAHGILGEFGPIVGFERDAQLITPGYQRELLTEALAGGLYQHLDVRLPRRRVDDLVLLAGRLGDHLRKPSELIDAQPASPDAVWAQRAEMAQVLDRYAAIKRRYNAVDFSDLITLAYEVVGDAGVAGRIRERYRVVLLDEYQDTNPAQRELLLRIFGNAFPVTAVGDPDQTIYEWRGASLWNFAGFPDHFTNQDHTPSASLTLSINRRCDRRIIDVANRVKKEIGADGGIAALQAAPDAGDGHVEVSWFHSAVDEARWLAGEVRRLHDEESIAWRDMGILFRKNRQIHLVREALQDEDVPVEVAALGGLLQVPEVVDLHAWLRLIGRPDDAPSLVRILLGARFRLGLGDLAPLADWVRRQRHDHAEEDEAAPGWAMLEAVDQLEQIDSLTVEAQQRLTDFRDLYRHLLAEAQAVTLVELCRRILEGTGAWAEVEALDGAARLTARLNLYRFLDLAEEWSPLEGRPSLDAFLDYLDLLEEDAGSEELDTARLSNEDAVSMLTVHRAKGLEWNTVFVPAVAAGTFPSYPHGGLEDPTRYPKVLPFELRMDQSQDGHATKTMLEARHRSQEWRTAYVAVTRAKHRLYVTGAFWYSTGQAKRPSTLFDSIRNAPRTYVHHEETSEGSPPALLRIEDAIGAPDPHFPDGWHGALRATIDDPDWPASAADDQADVFDDHRRQLRLVLDGLPDPPDVAADLPLTTSVTGLVTYATCPKRYFWTAVDPLPRRPSPAARKGVEVHRRIELHSLGVVPLEDVDLDRFDLPMDEAKPSTGGVDPFETYRSSRFATTQPRFVEVPFDLRIDHGARVNGRIDAIYESEPGCWEIVDFKTGRPSQHSSALVQLEAYALAVDEVRFAPFKPDQIQVTFAYLGGGLTEVSESVDSSWLAAARDHLGNLTGMIRREDWEPSPSTACHSCDFRRFCPAGREWIAAGN